MGEFMEGLATDLARELSELLDAFLATIGKEDRHSPEGNNIHNMRKAALEDFLWDNKIGILRILQAFARTPKRLSGSRE